MKGFMLSLRSEFYKSRKTLGFWAAILLPFLLLTIISAGYYFNSDKVAGALGLVTWMRYAGIAINVMGILLLPMFVIFIAYSVNSIEHRADTWKTLFSLPINKWYVYGAKFFYALLLVFFTLLMFGLFTLGYGNLLGLLKPEINFADYHIENVLLQVYFKLFLSALGILSIQFLLSLLWSDFLKPMGIGFLLFIAGVISVNVGWKYNYIIPHAHPLLAIQSLFPRQRKGPVTQILVDILTQEVYISMAISVVVFIAGFYIVQKRSVK